MLTYTPQLSPLITTRTQFAFGAGDVLARHVLVEHGAQERRVGVGVQQIQRTVAAQALLGVDEVQRDIERALAALRHGGVRRLAAEVDADIGIDLAIDGELRRNIDIGVIEIGQFLFPIGIFEFEEEGAQRLQVVERFVAVGLDVGGL